MYMYVYVHLVIDVTQSIPSSGTEEAVRGAASTRIKRSSRKLEKRLIAAKKKKERKEKIKMIQVREGFHLAKYCSRFKKEQLEIVMLRTIRRVTRILKASCINHACGRFNAQQESN